MGKYTPYNETLLHWLWENQHMENHRLETASGKKVRIHHPGYHNTTDGPDFTNARISIGQLKWHGDIEIHWSSRDWFHHNHHTDPNFNRVILHVVYHQKELHEIKRQDGTSIPTLFLQPFLSKSLQYFFRHYQQSPTLPCAGNIADIPKTILQQQFEQAHNEYFEQKVDDLLNFYDATLPLSEAWKNALLIALFDGLGISHNREPMRTLANRLLALEKPLPTGKKLTQKALRIAGINSSNSESSFNWKRKGSRPANHPETRIKQGCQLFIFVQKKSFKWWLRTDPKESFDAMLDEVRISAGIGRHRAGILFGTVWLPAHYLLGDLTARKILTSKAKKGWSKHRTRLPSSIIKPYKQTGITPEIYRKKLGTVHQYRAYCKPHRCQQCKVFNFLISS